MESWDMDGFGRYNSRWFIFQTRNGSLFSDGLFRKMKS
ncbi:hypothetical protein TW91_1901 [Neisseria flavescens]|nr:hypothetical protein TW91_1901 [Neisseria flavescens]